MPKFQRHYLLLPILLLLAAAGRLAIAQAETPAAAPASPAPSTAPAIAQLRPALAQVSQAVESLKIQHWKAPGDLRSSTEEDVASIQKDLTTTLPPLLDQAQADGAPDKPLAPSFTVFRNIDALYDVLLRVTEMANLAGSSAEAGQLEDARAALEGARAGLATSLFQSVTAQDAQLAHFRAAAAAAPAAKAAPQTSPGRVVVDDGPATPKRHKKKPPAHPATPAAPPAPQ